MDTKIKVGDTICLHDLMVITTKEGDEKEKDHLDSFTVNTILDSAVHEDPPMWFLLESHLAPKLLFRVHIDEIAIGVIPAGKSYTERCMLYIKSNLRYLGFEDTEALKYLCLYFVMERRLTGVQKGVLSNIYGKIAKILLEDDVVLAMSVIKEGEGILDHFNKRWLENFTGLFNGTQRISSKSQRISLFNIAGFVLAQKHPVVAQFKDARI